MTLSRQKSISIGTALACVSVTAAIGAPALLPPGWTQHKVPGDQNVIEYYSPDRHATLTLQDRGREALNISQFLHRDGDVVTYRQRKAGWTVVSGYQNGNIFYRRANLACHGTRWHLI